MQIIKREELPEQRQVRLTIAVDKDTWQASLAKCYQGVKSVCPVAGEPTRENLEQAYGPEFLYQEAVNDTYPQALVEAISQSDIQIAGTPTLSVETIGPDGYTFAAVIDLYPEVELGQYKGLSAVYPQVELSNDDTEAALDEYARANPDVQHPERAAMGDEVTLDFEGFVDGVPFEGGKGEQYPLLLGSGYFIPGFEEQVAGAAVGEERDVKVTFPRSTSRSWPARTRCSISRSTRSPGGPCRSGTMISPAGRALPMSLPCAGPSWRRRCRKAGPGGGAVRQ